MRGWREAAGRVGTVQAMMVGGRRLVHLAAPPVGDDPARHTNQITALTFPSERILHTHFHPSKRSSVLTTPPSPPAGRPHTAMAGPVATIVLRATWEPALEELQAATTAALASLTAALATPVALPGGGAVETLLAEHVRREAAAVCSTRYQRWPVEHRLVIP